MTKNREFSSIRSEFSGNDIRIRWASPITEYWPHIRGVYSALPAQLKYLNPLEGEIGTFGQEL